MAVCSRREFARICAGASAATVLSACGRRSRLATLSPVAEAARPQASSASEATLSPASGPGATTGRHNEAPMLAEAVARGDLPPVDERLPLQPLVLDVVEELGQYGGNWRRAYRGLADRWGPTKLIEEQGIAWRMAPGAAPYLVAGFFASWEVSPDGTEYTFSMRQGLRWSDGEPCDTEDVQFWFEHVLSNDTLWPLKPGWLAVGGALPTLTIVDEHTFRCSFSAPAPLLPISMAKDGGGLAGGPSLCAPAHYLRRYHPAFATSTEIEASLNKHQRGTWDALWGEGPVAFWFLNPNLPVVSAWRMRVSPTQDANRPIMERNPYYWQIDAEGRQLPYIDTIQHDLFDSPEVLNMKIVSGEIDCQNRHVDTARYALYRENQSRGNYRLVLWRNAATNCYYPNICTPDAQLAPLLNDARFREALSLAIDRDTINREVYDGLLTPRQASPIPCSPQYDAAYERRWAEYDPRRAEDLLDQLGLGARDREGYRLRTDAKTLSVEVEWTHSGYSGVGEEVALVCNYWRAVGIRAVPVSVDRTTYEEHLASNAFQISVWADDRNSMPMADPERYLGGHWAEEYKRWHDSGGAIGIAPPAGHPLYDIWALWETAQSEPDEALRLGTFQRIVAIHREHVWRIGTCGEDPAVFIVSQRMANVPADLVNDDTLRGIGLAQPAQFFYRA